MLVIHRHRVLFSPGGGGGGGGGAGWVHLQIPVSWVGAGNTADYMHLYIYILKVHDYVHLYDKHSFHAWNFHEDKH